MNVLTKVNLMISLYCSTGGEMYGTGDMHKMREHRVYSRSRPGDVRRMRRQTQGAKAERTLFEKEGEIDESPDRDRPQPETEVPGQTPYRGVDTRSNRSD